MEQVEAEVKEAKEQALKSGEKAQAAARAVGQLKYSLQVQAVQSALAQQGFEVIADGFLGPQTKSALR